MTVLPHLISTGILRNVQQIGVEFHWIGTEYKVEDFFDIVKGLFHQGFKVIYWEMNYFEKTPDGFPTTFEILFRKFTLPCETCSFFVYLTHHIFWPHVPFSSLLIFFEPTKILSKISLLFVQKTQLPINLSQTE